MYNTINYEFYCLSYNNHYKQKKMKKRFLKLGLPCKFYHGLNQSDYRLKHAGTKYNTRQWSITYSHLDIIHDFYYLSNKRYAVICEDDICIDRNIKKNMSRIINDFVTLDLDILLLGCLLPYKLDGNNTNYRVKTNKTTQNLEMSGFNYYNYPEYLAGTHMYMISRSYAKHILDNYYTDYAGIQDKAFISDKILIKNGNRALLYPILAIEDEEQTDKYHQFCHKINYNESFV